MRRNTKYKVCCNDGLCLHLLHITTSQHKAVGKATVATYANHLFLQTNLYYCSQRNKINPVQHTNFPVTQDVQKSFYHVA